MDYSQYIPIPRAIQYVFNIQPPSTWKIHTDTMSGAIHAGRPAKSASLTLDASRTWTVPADSHLASLVDAAGISGASLSNILGKGHTVYYDASNSANSALNGLSYTPERRRNPAAREVSLPQNIHPGHAKRTAPEERPSSIDRE